jgi:hypothetical protein
MISRLSSTALDLVARLEQLLPDPFRRVTASAAGFAVERTTLAEDRLDAALAALHDGRFGDTAERLGVQHLTDDIVFHLMGW